jgi:hypothetical protein
MPQRPADYKSTKNVGGNRKVEPDSGPAGDMFGYMKMKPEHAYLEHFKNPKYLKDGHNTISAEGLKYGAARRVLRQGLRAPGAGVSAAGGAFQGTVGQVAAAHPVLAARAAGREAVQRARRTGGNVQQVKADRRAIVAAARKLPESQRSRQRRFVK